MNNEYKQTGINNATFGDNAKVEITQNINSPPVKEKPKPNLHNLPNLSIPLFVGREKVLDELHQQLQEKDTIAISTLTGMGGIGKTELALQYAWKYWQQEIYKGGICWVNVGNSEVGLYLLNFASLNLGLTLPVDIPLEDRIRLCWQLWLKNEQDQALIIFDNVQNYGQLENYLPPQKDKRFKVIITTRAQFLSTTIKNLHLDELDENSALELLRSYVKDGRIDAQIERAKLLCKDLGYLPLALELVARLLVRRKGWTIEKIRDKLKEKGLEEQSLIRDPKFHGEMTAKRGVKAAFDVSWDELNTEHFTKN